VIVPVIVFVAKHEVVLVIILVIIFVIILVMVLVVLPVAVFVARILHSHRIAK
jgi:hypothetical protein